MLLDVATQYFNIRHCLQPNDSIVLKQYTEISVPLFLVIEQLLRKAPVDPVDRRGPGPWTAGFYHVDCGGP